MLIQITLLQKPAVNQILQFNNHTRFLNDSDFLKKMKRKILITNKNKKEKKGGFNSISIIEKTLEYWLM